MSSSTPKHEVPVNNVYTFSSYLTANTLRLEDSSRLAYDVVSINEWLPM